MTSRDGFCDACRSIEQRQQDDTPWRRRAKVFYHSRAWLRVRDEVLARDPVCVECGIALSTDGAHKIPLRECIDTTLALDLNNLQGKCGRCHKVESGSQSRAMQGTGRRTA